MFWPLKNSQAFHDGDMAKCIQIVGMLNKDGFFQALLGKWNKKQEVNDGLGRIFPLDQLFS